MGKEKMGMKVYNLDSVSLKGWMKTWSETLKWSWSCLKKKCCCGFVGGGGASGDTSKKEKKIGE